jgi:hypothetical protein
MRRLILLVLSAALLPSSALSKPPRDPHQRAAFIKAHPCPSTGKTRGACPGYFVDHVTPLCAGGRDHSSNMQWETREEAKVKDRRSGRCVPGERGVSTDGPDDAIT